MENYQNYEDEIDKDEVVELANKIGIKYLFPWQRFVIQEIIDSYNFSNENQIVLLPTGAGKSLCFQIPAFIFTEPSLIIYPLLALMSDQQRRMEEIGLKCVVFRGNQTENEWNENFTKIKNGAKIILANPEILLNNTLTTKLNKIGISHIAIDEAHCVSQWGDSFRPAYLELGKIIKNIKPKIVTAFTATASPEVLERVNEVLFEKKAKIIRAQSDRPNIHYSVINCVAKKKKVLELIKTQKLPAIIFCGTRNSTEDMAQEINVCFSSQIAMFYHAGLTKEEKDFTEKWFFESKSGVLCATCAYGMGVDKKNIRTVIHLDSPQNAEAYIQEAGRGGRDGESSKAILLWSLNDEERFSKFPDDSREKYMQKFAQTKNCRREILLEALGDEFTYCNGCDLCDKNEEIQKNPKKKIKSEFSDWNKTYKLITKKQNYFSSEELEHEIFIKMNHKNQQKLGLNIWTHKDSSEVLSQLYKSNKIKQRSFLWKGKICIKKEIK